MKKFLKKKNIIILAVILMVLAISAGKVYGIVKGIPVSKETLTAESYEKYYVEEGTVSSKNLMKKFSPVSGNVAEILKSEGSEVKKGDLILKIYSEDLEYKLEILKAQKLSLIGQKNSEVEITKGSDLKSQKELIAIAKKNKEDLERDLEVQQKLYETGAVSEDELRNSQSAYDKAVRELSIENYKYTTLAASLKMTGGKKQFYENEIKKVDLEIENLEKDIEDANVKSPIDGILSSMDISTGDYVSTNQLLFEVFDPDYYEIEAYLLAKESRNIEEGMEAYLEVEENSQTRTVKCQIISISKSAKELVSTLGLKEKKVKVIVAPTEDVKLIQGEAADVKFITYKKDNAQVISKDYIFPWNEGDGIWIIEDGRAKIVKIEKEFETSSFLVLKDNFPEGTEIITPEYPEKLAEGVKVY